ncbi:MAG: hypothetical protein LBQ51_02365 [Desulfovibrio sp.]|jgi:hypothetical protein|nr:hypothetical protein [Desulfovibrio sp.]
MPNILQTINSNDKLRRKMARYMKLPGAKEKSREYAKKYHKAGGYRASHNRSLAREGLIPSMEAQKMTGIRRKTLEYLIAVKAIERTKSILCWNCYTVEQVSCLMQAKIYGTVDNAGKEYVNFVKMAEYLKTHWPKWEGERYEHRSYKSTKNSGGAGKDSSRHGSPDNGV